jgi:hypothetical protein
MKKVIIGLSGMVLIAIVVILFVNAQSSKAEEKKATTEVSAKCAGCKDAATCPEMKGTATATATAGKAACCDSTKTAATKTEACASASAACETTCPMKATLPTK